MMNEYGKSDSSVVPGKRPNKVELRSAESAMVVPKRARRRKRRIQPREDLRWIAGGGDEAAEVVEGRGLAKGNSFRQNAPWTQSQIRAYSALERVRQAFGVVT